MMKPKVTQCLRGHAYAEHAKLGNDGRYHCRTCAKIGRTSKTVRVDRKQYQDLVASHLRLRDKLMEVCAQCERCSGTGLITKHGGGSGDPEWDADDQPCPDCEDIREALC